MFEVPRVGGFGIHDAVLVALTKMWSPMIARLSSDSSSTKMGDEGIEEEASLQAAVPETF
jgi:hypothetical protein